MKPKTAINGKLIIALVLSGVGFSSEVRAAGMPVYDGVHTMQNVLTQMRTSAQSAAEFARQATRWAQQNQHNLAQLQQMARELIGMRKFLNTQGPSQPDFRERDIQDGIESKCLVKGRGVTGNLLNLSGLSGSKDYVGRQRELCAYKVMARNLQYNNTVALLRRMQQRSTQLRDISNARNAVGPDKGRLDANDNDIGHFMAATKMDMEEWQAVNSAYESYIVSLTEQGKDLSQEAMRGRNPVIGSVVQAVTLRAALAAARRN